MTPYRAPSFQVSPRCWGCTYVVRCLISDRRERGKRGGTGRDRVRNWQRLATSFQELGAVAECNSHQFWNTGASRSSAPELLLNGNGIFDDAPDVISDLNGDGVVDEKDLKLLRVASNIKKDMFFINGNL